MDAISPTYKNPDEVAALSESLLKQGIAKTKLDADRMAEGMAGNKKNERPSGQKFHFGFENEKVSDAKIDNYSGPSKLADDAPQATRDESSQNRFFDSTPRAPPSILDNKTAENYDVFESLHSKITETQEQLTQQRSVIENLKSEIANLKDTHQVFHSRMEELHNKVGQEVPHQKPFVGDSAVRQLDTMMQQPVNMKEETLREESDVSFAKEVVQEVEVAEGRMSEDDEFIRKTQENNPVPKHKVVDIDLGNIFSK